jgi:hypothetical protein
LTASAWRAWTACSGLAASCWLALSCLDLRSLRLLVNGMERRKG